MKSFLIILFLSPLVIAWIAIIKAIWDAFFKQKNHQFQNDICFTLLHNLLRITSLPYCQLPYGLIFVSFTSKTTHEKNYARQNKYTGSQYRGWLYEN